MSVQHPTPTTPPSYAHDRGYAGAQTRPSIADEPLAGLQAVCGLAGALAGDSDTDDVKHFQQHLAESGTRICTRNQTMTGVKFLLHVTLRRHDLVAEAFSLKEPVKVRLVLSRDEVKRLVLFARA